MTAVIGQEKVKKALLLNMINPAIGGVVISGHRGTAKSAIVRGLSYVIEDMDIVDVPLNITEESLVGEIDIEKTLKIGKKISSKGLLERGKGNIIYFDEINLMPESILSIVFESLFNTTDNTILVGTMNPEEGSLSNHFLDKIGLYVECNTIEDYLQRKEIIKNNLEYEYNPYSFIKNQKNNIEDVKKSLSTAKNIFKKISVNDTHIRTAVEISKECGCQGHRCEILLLETAKAIAAYNMRKYVSLEDIQEASEYVLPHRMRENPHDHSKENMQDDSNKSNNPNEPSESDNSNESNEQSQSNRENDTNSQDESNTGNIENEKPSKNNIDDGSYEKEEVQSPIDFKYSIKLLDKEKHKSTPLKNQGTGKRIKTITNKAHGRYIKYRIPNGRIKDIAFDATIRAAVPYQRYRRKNNLAIVIKKEDLREKVRLKRTGTSILFVVDASGSMGAFKRMEAVKGAVISMLMDAYQNRDKVGVIAFRKDRAELLLNITRSVDLAKKRLAELPTGGRTPLSEGLKKAYSIVHEEMYKDINQEPIVVIISDFRPNYSINSKEPVEETMEEATRIKSLGCKTIIIDTEKGFIKVGIGRKIADIMGSKYYKLDDFNDNIIEDIVRFNKM